MIQAFTDGSCHTQLEIGSWAAIIINASKEKIVLSGQENDTTHQRMEIVAVIEAINYIRINFPLIKEISIISDSQYVVDLPKRGEKLMSNDYVSKKGNATRNADLVKNLFDQTSKLLINFEKIKAHQQKQPGTYYNIEADKLCRKLVRAAVIAATT